MAIIRKKYIGLLGGSFDPAHKGHLNITKIVLKKFKLKKVFWVVAKKNPFKNKSFYSLDERIKFAKKISINHKKIKVIHVDSIIKSSRSIDVVNYFIKRKKLKNIYFIVGSDNLINFHRWKNWKKIVKLVKLVVFSRKGYDKKSKKSVVVKYLNKKNIIYVNNKMINVSSSIIKKDYLKRF